MLSVEKNILKDCCILYNISKGGKKMESNEEINVENKNINNNYMFRTFNLRYNSKLPSDEWTKDETKTYHLYNSILLIV